MNERMAELFGQAGISDSINEEFGIEYLAELIIGECANVAADHDALDIYEEIREHFGLLKAGENMSDKGYSIGTKEGYDAFVEKRSAGNRSETLE